MRINPRQVHINDPDFYEQIYAGSKSRRDKDTSYPPRLSASLSVISTIPHNHHRIRRSVMNQFFSKQSIIKLEPIIQDKTDKIADHFKKSFETGTVLNLEYAFSALTADVITHYCYGTSYRYLEDQFPENDLRDAFGGLFLLNHILYFFPPLCTILNNIPPRLMQLIDSKSSVMVFLRERLYKQSSETLQRKSSVSKQERETIFDALLNPDLPPSEKTVERLSEEALILLGAGSETTANTMALCSYYLTKNKPVLERLREELRQVMHTPESSPAWSDLEKLPYLVRILTPISIDQMLMSYVKSAVVNETLRLAIGGSWRLPRVSPNEPLVYGKHLIPAGVSSTILGFRRVLILISSPSSGSSSGPQRGILFYFNRQARS